MKRTILAAMFAMAIAHSASAQSLELSGTYKSRPYSDFEPMSPEMEQSVERCHKEFHMEQYIQSADFDILFHDSPYFASNWLGQDRFLFINREQSTLTLVAQSMKVIGNKTEERDNRQIVILATETKLRVEKKIVRRLMQCIDMAAATANTYEKDITLDGDIYFFITKNPDRYESFYTSNPREGSPTARLTQLLRDVCRAVNRKDFQALDYLSHNFELNCKELRKYTIVH